MRISELARHQIEWESARGIKNGNWGVDRIQEEIDEARDEESLRAKLVELCDVIIIATGSAGTLAQYLGMEMEQLENLIGTKLMINDLKYPLREDWDRENWQEEMSRCKQNWMLDK